MNSKQILIICRNYIRDEHLDKKGKSIDLTQWNALHVQDVPQQMNGSDCGMFACKYAEFISRGKTMFGFNQVGFLFLFFFLQLNLILSLFSRICRITDAE